MKMSNGFSFSLIIFPVYRPNQYCVNAGSNSWLAWVTLVSWGFLSGRDSLSPCLWEDVEVCISCDFVYFWELYQESGAGR